MDLDESVQGIQMKIFEYIDIYFTWKEIMKCCMSSCGVGWWVPQQENMDNCFKWAMMRSDWLSPAPRDPKAALNSFIRPASPLSVHLPPCWYPNPFIKTARCLFAPPPTVPSLARRGSHHNNTPIPKVSIWQCAHILHDLLIFVCAPPAFVTQRRSE